MNRVKGFLEAKGINHTQFNALVIVLMALVVYIVVRMGAAEGLPTIFGGVALNVACFLALAFGLQFFWGGTGRDVNAAIFDKGNVAVAYYMGALFIALALLIKG